MKSLLINGFILLVSFLWWNGPVVAGGLSTPGQGARALSMTGAVTAVADDGSAVYYNPAGLGQVEGTTIEGGLNIHSPRLRYTMPSDVTETSDKKTLAPSFFVTHRLSDRLRVGVGVYSAYARDAKLTDDLANGFVYQRAKIIRTDLSAVVAWQASDNLSIGGGLVVGYSQLDRSTPAGPALRIIDKMDGVGVGGIVALLWRASDRVKTGLTYRSEMRVAHDGERTLLAGGIPISSNARAVVYYPASLGLGIAVNPTPRLTLALDVDWYGWSSMDQVTTRTDAWPDSVTPLNASDSRDIRFGAEYRLPAGWALRAGYAYGEAAFPGTHLIPAQPDGDGHEIGLGVGRTSGPWRLDFAYHYSVTEEAKTSANVFGFNGKYNIDQHVLGLTAAYRI